MDFMFRSNSGSVVGLAASPLVLTLALGVGLAGCGDDSAATVASASATDATATTGETDATGTTADSEAGTDSEGTDSEAGTDSETGEMLNDFPVGGCGLPEYPLVDRAGMGEVTDWEELYSFTAPEIDDLLALQGFEALGPAKSGARLYIIRYVTQDRGVAVETTGFVATPTDLEGPLPAAVWMHGTSGFNDACGPPGDSEGGFVPLLMASMGIIAVAPDYLGLNGWGKASGMLHPYVVAEPTAIASLDSIRALRRFAEGEGDPDLEVHPSDQTLLWGASEGGFAAFWADRYAPHYAPEIDITAVIAAVPPTDTTALTKYATSGLSPATGALAAALATGHEWYEMEEPLSDVLVSPWDAELKGILLEECSFSEFDGVESVDAVYTEWLQEGLAADDVEGLGAWGCMLEQATLHSSVIERITDTPVLVTLGELDDLVYTPTVREDIPTLCEQGYDIEVIECAGAGHTEGAIFSLGYQRDWAFARLAGEEIEGACIVSEPVDCSAL